MTYYNKIKKLDLESAQKMQEGTGPSDQCLCSVLAAPEDTKRSISGSIKKVFASLGGIGKGKNVSKGGSQQGSGGGRDMPLNFAKGGKDYTGITTKQTVKRTKPCGKCGCDKNQFVLKHNDLNIKVISPDISSICPCPNDCLPREKGNLANNIKVTVEHLNITTDESGSEDSLHNATRTIPEGPEYEAEIPQLTASEKSITELINAQFDIEEFDDNESQWSFSQTDPNDNKELGKESKDLEKQGPGENIEKSDNGENSGGAQVD